MIIPIRPLSLEIRTLLIKDRARKLSNGEINKVELINNTDIVTGEIGHQLINNHQVKVYNSEDKYELLSIAEFAANYEVPNIKSLETLYPHQWQKWASFVRSIYEAYKLIPYEFQIKDLGLLLMLNKVILSYEQGLGKTICGLIWARLKRIYNSDLKVSLFIVQEDLIEQWKEEGKKVGICLKEINKDNKSVSQGHYITHYEYLRKYYREYIDSFQLIVLDEAHKIKSGNALRGIAIRSLNSKYKLCLTGTPIKNIVSDLHFLMGWLYGFKTEIYPYAHNEQTKFKKDFGVYEVKNGKKKMIPCVSNIHELQLMLSPAILRRDIMDTGVKMTKRYLYLVGVEFTETQLKAYKDIQANINEQTTRDYRLRLNCAIFPGNNKIKMLKKIVKARLSKGEQIIIFTGLVPAGEKYLELFGRDARLVNGNVQAHNRGTIIKQFKEGTFPVLIAGIEAVNAGHSLQNCNNVVITDYPWTASTLDQACGRVRRIVSSKDINIFMLYTKGSYDERNLEIITQKRESSENVLDGENDFKFVEIDWQRIINT